MNQQSVFNTDFNVEAGNLTFNQARAISERLTEIVQHVLQFDEVRCSVDEHSFSSQIFIKVAGWDKFNALEEFGEYSTPYTMTQFDLPDDWMHITEATPWDESIDPVLQKILERIGKFPGRQVRERRHMAFVLKGQYERLGHYSPDLVKAFQEAFQKSMRDSGLLALVDMSEAAE